MNSVVAAILAGGQSRRMGRDKAEIVWQGETLLARTVRVAQTAGCAVVVVGREPPENWGLSDVRFAPDAFADQGPLGGLATALQAARANVLLLACDMPLLTPSALQWLVRQHPAKHGTAVRNGDRWEPLFSLYTPEVLPHALEQLAGGRRSLQGLIDTGQFQEAPAPPEVAKSLINVNTPGDLTRLPR